MTEYRCSTVIRGANDRDSNEEDDYSGHRICGPNKLLLLAASVSHTRLCNFSSFTPHRHKLDAGGFSICACLSSLNESLHESESKIQPIAGSPAILRFPHHSCWVLGTFPLKGLLHGQIFSVLSHFSPVHL